MAAPGATITPILTDAPQDLVGTLTVAVRSLPEETVLVAATTAGIVEHAQGDDTSNYVATIALPDDATDGAYEVVWDDGTVEVTESLTIDALAYSSVTPFATAAMVQKRLGRDTAYTGSDLEQVEYLLAAASDEILAAAGKTAEWAADLSDTPSVFRNVCVEVVTRVLLNPDGVTSAQEQLGAYSHGQTFRRDITGLELTSREQRLVRRAANGLTSFVALTLETPYSGTTDDDDPELPLDAA